MNSVIITGNLVRDPDVRVNEAGLTIAKFTIANQDGYGDSKHVSFVDAIAFGKKAEAIGKYFSKGQAIMISGRLKQDSYVGKDGVKKIKYAIVIEGFEFMGRKSESEMPQESPEMPIERVAIYDKYEESDLPF